jgi:hypothetical protein
MFIQIDHHLLFFGSSQSTSSTTTTFAPWPPHAMVAGVPMGLPRLKFPGWKMVA